MGSPESGIRHGGQRWRVALGVLGTNVCNDAPTQMCEMYLHKCGNMSAQKCETYLHICGKYVYTDVRNGTPHRCVKYVYTDV